MVQLKGNITLVRSTLAQVYSNLLFTISSYKNLPLKSLSTVHTRFRIYKKYDVTKRYTILVTHHRLHSRLFKSERVSCFPLSKSHYPIVYLNWHYVPSK